MDTKAIQSSIEKLMKMVSVMNKKGAVGNMDKALNYLKGAQTAKGLSIVSAIAFGIWAMGILQTNVVLKLREKLTGSTENEAITNLEKQIRHQMAFEGNNNSSNALKTIAQDICSKDNNIKTVAIFCCLLFLYMYGRLCTKYWLP